MDSSLDAPGSDVLRIHGDQNVRRSALLIWEPLSVALVTVPKMCIVSSVLTRFPLSVRSQCSLARFSWSALI